MPALPLSTPSQGWPEADRHTLAVAYDAEHLFKWNEADGHDGYKYRHMLEVAYAAARLLGGCAGLAVLEEARRVR